MNEQFSPIAFAITVVLAAITFAITRYWEIFSSERGRHYKIPLVSLWRLMSAFFTFLFAPVLGILFTWLLFETGIIEGAIVTNFDPSVIGAIVGAVISASLMLTLWSTTAESKQLWKLGGQSSSMRALGIGIAVGILVFPWVLSISQLLSWGISFVHDGVLEEQVAVQFVRATLDNPLLFIGTMLAIGGGAPLIEELLFRGFLFAFIRSRLSYYETNTLVSTLFAAFHFAPAQGVANFALLPPLFFLSWILGGLRERKGNMWVPIAVHSTFNLITLFLIWVGVV